MVIDDFQERNSMLAAIIESSEDAIISKNLEGIVISWNKAAERMFGYTEAEMKGKHISILIPPDRLPEEDMIISNLRAGRRIEHFQTIRLTNTGRQLYVSLSVSPIKNAEGQVVGASKIARDITHQKEAEDEIRKYNEQLQLINAVGRAISAHLDVKTILEKVTDTTTRLSRAAIGAFYFNHSEPTGNSQPMEYIAGGKQFPLPADAELLRITFEGRRILRLDDITRESGQRQASPADKAADPIHITSFLGVPVASATGNVIGGLFFGHPQPGWFTDEHENLVAAIASQASVALDNAKLYEEVRHLNNKKDEFISLASHELKTPLTTMNGFLQLAEKNPAMAQDLIPKIRKQVGRLSAIIADLLDISKIHAGKLEFHFSTVNLQSLIRECLETVKPFATGFQIETEIPTTDIDVVVDAQKLSQVIINLLTNAIKYSKPGTTITLSCTRLGDQVRISVQDQGMGIAPQHLNRIFNRFYRISKSSSTAEGMGLGLYISQEIVAGHNGRIWAESEEGKGSVFHVDFPIRMSE